MAARHLKHFGYIPTIYYPKRSTKGDGLRLFGNLVKQLEDLNVPFIDTFPSVYISPISNNVERSFPNNTISFLTECSVLAFMELLDPLSIQ